MKKKLHTLIIFLILSLGNLHGQDMNKVLFNETYSHNHENSDLIGKKICALDNKEYIVLADGFYKNYTLIRYDSLGNTIWNKSFDDMRINDIKIYKNEIFLLGKVTYEGKMFLLKLDLGGELIWKKEYRIRYENKGITFKISKSGEIYVLCHVQRAGFPIKVCFNCQFRYFLRFPGRSAYIINEKLTILKLDNNGNLVWRKIIGNITDSTSGIDIEINNENEVCIIADYLKPNSHYLNSWVVKLSNTGKIIYEKELHEINLKSIVLNEGNDFMLIGSNSKIDRTTNDTVYIYTLDDNNTLKKINELKSEHGEISINSTRFERSSNLLFACGSARDLQNKSQLKHYEKTWTAKISLSNNIIEEWSKEFEYKERINDFIIQEDMIVCTGESITRGTSRKMRIMKLNK